ncbi:MAG: hypothetical protein WC917_02470 [Bacilli bacterium]|jgi:hypothetical protein
MPEEKINQIIRENEKINQVIKEVEELGSKMDGHFQDFKTLFCDNEKNKFSLVKATNERMNKMDIMMHDLKVKHDTEYMKLARRMPWIYVFLFLAYVCIVILSIVK